MSAGAVRFPDWLRAHAFTAGWSLVWAGSSLVCLLNLHRSEWAARLLPLGAQLFILGGLLPLSFSADGLRSQARARWILWYVLLCAGAVASLLGWRGMASGNIYAAASLAVVLIAISLGAMPKKRFRLGIAWLLFILSFAVWPTPPSFDGSQTAGRQLFGDYGCILCHREGRHSLIGLPNRLDRRLSAEGKAVASPRAWIYLRLYAPNAFSTQGDSVCPPYRSLFARTPSLPGLPSPWALPVVTPEGTELLPTAQARLLADYLLSLRTPEPGGASASREATLALGEALFYAKCSVCHGRDGRGDALNYPPLDDPQWLNLPEEEFLDIAMSGKKGKINVHGREWDGVMLPPGIAEKGDASAVRLYLRHRFLQPRLSPAP